MGIPAGSTGIGRAAPGRTKARLRDAGVLVLALVGGLVLADRIWPVDLAPAPQARVVLAEDGRVLRAFPDARGYWRYPVRAGAVSGYYLEALVGYEDRYFFHHPGVNPVSLVRAAWHWIRHGRVISGGSTLTMQVARLRYPGRRGVGGKLLQVLRALQLEWHYDKDEILDYYLNHAPFGGTLEGVEAASRAYFGHSARHLTRAQAALLAVLPQAPSRYRPDRHPESARRARDKLLLRLAGQGVWDRAEVVDAMLEGVGGRPLGMPQSAPLLARRLIRRDPAPRLHSLIDAAWQARVEQLLREHVRGIGERVSAAVLIMEHGSAAVRVYAGSAEFADSGRFGHVDMVRALRSPGSTLKPFVYGMALDAGLIHSESLLLDVPLRFGDYQPANFRGGHAGAVSVAEALGRSLNVPAVQVLERLGPTPFYLQMRQAGARLVLPQDARPNLAIALGGVGITLEDLVSAYSSLGNRGRALRPRWLRDQPLRESGLLSPGAAWIVHRMLADAADSGGGMAVKTGTSYGYRDAWALGVDDQHTYGVWVGRPDGTALPGHYGALTAVPLLERLRRSGASYRQPSGPPAGVSRMSICWPGGTVEASQCDVRRRAWVLDGMLPRTWMSAPADRRAFVQSEFAFWVGPDHDRRVTPACAPAARRIRVSLWPDRLQPWLASAMRTAHRVPDWDPDCRQADAILSTGPILLAGIDDGDAFQVDPGQLFRLQVSAVGGETPVHWFLNRRLLPGGKRERTLRLEPGRKYELTVLDSAGQSVRRGFQVLLRP